MCRSLSVNSKTSERVSHNCCFLKADQDLIEHKRGCQIWDRRCSWSRFRVDSGNFPAGKFPEFFPIFPVFPGVCFDRFGHGFSLSFWHFSQTFWSFRKKMKNSENSHLNTWSYKFQIFRNDRKTEYFLHFMLESSRIQKKIHHFESRGELNCDFKNFKKFQKNF